MKRINLLIFIICLTIIASFFMPWIAGSGSLAKPLDDSTSIIQNIEPTGLFRVMVKTAKGTVDAATALISPINLDRKLKGYEIPIADETEGLRPKIYLIYILPLIALIVFFAVLKRKQTFAGKIFRFVFVITIASFLFIQVESLNRERLFLKIEALYGFFLTLYGYMALSILTFLKIFSRQTTKSHKRKRRVYN